LADHTDDNSNTGYGVMARFYDSEGNASRGDAFEVFGFESDNEADGAVSGCYYPDASFAGDRIYVAAVCDVY